MEKCEQCQKEYDFTKHTVGECFTCGKKPLCYDCCYSHQCVPGKGRRLGIIAGPSWTVNLKPPK